MVFVCMVPTLRKQTATATVTTDGDYYTVTASTVGWGAQGAHDDYVRSPIIYIYFHDFTHIRTKTNRKRRRQGKTCRNVIKRVAREHKQKKFGYHRTGRWLVVWYTSKYIFSRCALAAKQRAEVHQSRHVDRQTRTLPWTTRGPGCPRTMQTSSHHLHYRC